MTETKSQDEGGGGVHIEYMPLTELLGRRHEGNPKLHALEDLGQSIARFGWVGSVLLDDETAGGTGKLLAGHGRLKALAERKAKGKGAPQRIEVRDGEWHVPVTRGCRFNSLEEAEAYLLADNQLTIKGGYDTEALLEMARRNFKQLGTLEGTGFSLTELNDLEAEYRASLALMGGGGDDGEGGEGGEGEGEGKERDPNTGDWLTRIECRVGEPRHKVEMGEVWVMQPTFHEHHHLLVVGDFTVEWSRWIGLLEPGMWLVPFPGLYSVFSVEGRTRPFLMVHTDKVMVGHILDRFTDVFGEEAAWKRG